MSFNVTVNELPPAEAVTSLLAYTGSSVEYVGYAKSKQPCHQFSVAAGTITNIVVSSNTATATITAHGLATGQRITISGATVDTDLNSTTGYVITVTTADAFTFTTASVADATYTDAGLVVATTAPRTNAACWAIKKLTYTTSLLTATRWAEGSTAAGNIWDNRATLAYA